EAGLARGRKMTSYRSMATDVKNAAAHGPPSTTTSRSTQCDLEAFSAKIIEEMQEGVHELESSGLIFGRSNRVFCEFSWPAAVFVASTRVVAVYAQCPAPDKTPFLSSCLHCGKGDRRPT